MPKTTANYAPDCQIQPPQPEIILKKEFLLYDEYSHLKQNDIIKFHSNIFIAVNSNVIRHVIKNWELENKDIELFLTFEEEEQTIFNKLLADFKRDRILEVFDKKIVQVRLELNYHKKLKSLHYDPQENFDLDL